VTALLWAYTLRVACALAVLALLLLLAVRARALPETRLRTVIALAGIALAGVAIFTRLDPASIPTPYLTMLHEGNSERVIRNVVSLGAHAGDGYKAIEEMLAASPHPDIRDVVRANLWFAIIASSLLWCIARERSGRASTAWLATALFVLNPLTVNAALSELPSMLIAVEILAALTAASVALDPHPALQRTRNGALVTLLLFGAVATTTRAEMFLLFAPVTAAVAAHVLGGPELVQRWDLALATSARRVFFASRWRTVLLVALLLAIPLALLPFYLGMALSWANPLEPRVLALPLVLAECLPWGAIVLAILGVLRLARQPVRWLLLPWAMLGLARVYAKASHGAGFEMERYASMLLAPVVLFAVEGWVGLRAHAGDRGWPAAWRSFAIAVLAATCLMPPGIGTSRAWPGAWPIPRDARDLLLLRRSTQVELRWLMTRVDAEPACVFISRVAADGRFDSRSPRWTWVVFGRKLGGTVEVSPERPAAEVLRELAPEGACTRFYRSMDCELPGAEGCVADIRGARTVDETTVTALPYSDPDEYGSLPPLVTLGVYDLGVREAATPSGPRDRRADDACAPAVAAWAASASKRTGVAIHAVACLPDRVRLHLEGAGCDYEVVHGPGFRRTRDDAFAVTPIVNIDWNAALSPMTKGLDDVLEALAIDPTLPVGATSAPTAPSASR
jgi:hypothetical protein